jgi:sigma-B regulation protein RsbU (phosphoserine phosphatase)
VSESGQWPPAVRELARAPGVQASRADSCRHACDPALLSKADAVIVCDADNYGAPSPWYSEIASLSNALVTHRLMGIVLSSGTAGVMPGEGDALMLVPPEASAEELWGRIATIRQYRPLLIQMEQQLATMQRLGNKLNQHFSEVDQELRLASRLQRDFLPRCFPEVGQIRFAALYRPATWVSGDVYDVRRLDETRLSCYVADAAGHGVAAGLLTMFIKQAMVGKRIEHNDYTILMPETVLAGLNTALAEQELPNYQFVTACYCVINTVTNELCFARGGHPHPVHVTADGQCSEIHTVGGLLGVFADKEFPGVSLILRPGEKIVLYSDGMENTIITERDRASGQVTYTEDFLKVAHLPCQALIDALSAQLDRPEGSLEPPDDQTCLIIERLA